MTWEFSEIYRIHWVGLIHTQYLFYKGLYGLN